MVPLGQGEQRGGDPVPGWEQVGQRGEEGEKVFARQGRGGSRGSSQMESWHHPRSAEQSTWKGKPHKHFLPQRMLTGEAKVDPDSPPRRHTLLSCLHLTGPCVTAGLRSSVSECPVCHQTQAMGYWKVPGSLGNPGCRSRSVVRRRTEDRLSWQHSLYGPVEMSSSSAQS